MQVEQLTETCKTQLAEFEQEMNRDPSLRAGPAQSLKWHVGQVIVHRKVPAYPIARAAQGCLIERAFCCSMSTEE